MNTPDRVSIWKYVGLFALAYILLIIAAATVVALLGLKPLRGVNVASLAVAAIAAAYAFVKKHGRPFQGSEYWAGLAGSMAVDAVYQVIPALPILLAGKISASAFAIAVGFVVVLHGLLLAFLYSPRMVSRYGPKPSSPPSTS